MANHDTDAAQRDAARARANKVRYARRDLKRIIKDDRDAGVILVLELLGNPRALDGWVELNPPDGAPPGFAETMRVEQLLGAIPGLGPTKISRSAMRAGGHHLSERRIGKLTVAESTRLRQWLMDWRAKQDHYHTNKETRPDDR